jgi:hypothetical protein
MLPVLYFFSATNVTPSFSSAYRLSDISTFDYPLSFSQNECPVAFWASWFVHGAGCWGFSNILESLAEVGGGAVRAPAMKMKIG